MEKSQSIFSFKKFLLTPVVPNMNNLKTRRELWNYRHLAPEKGSTELSRKVQISQCWKETETRSFRPLSFFPIIFKKTNILTAILDLREPSLFLIGHYSVSQSGLRYEEACVLWTPIKIQECALSCFWCSIEKKRLF